MNKITAEEAKKLTLETIKRDNEFYKQFSENVKKRKDSAYPDILKKTLELIADSAQCGNFNTTIYEQNTDYLNHYSDKLISDLNELGYAAIKNYANNHEQVWRPHGGFCVEINWK